MFDQKGEIDNLIVKLQKQSKLNESLMIQMKEQKDHYETALQQQSQYNELNMSKQKQKFTEQVQKLEELLNKQQDKINLLEKQQKETYQTHRMIIDSKEIQMKQDQIKLDQLLKDNQNLSSQLVLLQQQNYQKAQENEDLKNRSMYQSGMTDRSSMNFLHTDKIEQLQEENRILSEQIVALSKLQRSYLPPVNGSKTAMSTKDVIKLQDLQEQNETILRVNQKLLNDNLIKGEKEMHMMQQIEELKSRSQLSMSMSFVKDNDDQHQDNYYDQINCNKTLKEQEKQIELLTKQLYDSQRQSNKEIQDQRAELESVKSKAVSLENELKSKSIERQQIEQQTRQDLIESLQRQIDDKSRIMKEHSHQQIDLQNRYEALQVSLQDEIKKYQLLQDTTQKEYELNNNTIILDNKIQLLTQSEQQLKEQINRLTNANQILDNQAKHNIQILNLTIQEQENKLILIERNYNHQNQQFEIVSSERDTLRNQIQLKTNEFKIQEKQEQDEVQKLKKENELLQKDIMEKVSKFQREIMSQEEKNIQNKDESLLMQEDMRQLNQQLAEQQFNNEILTNDITNAYNQLKQLQDENNNLISKLKQQEIAHSEQKVTINEIEEKVKKQKKNLNTLNSVCEEDMLEKNRLQTDYEEAIQQNVVLIQQKQSISLEKEELNKLMDQRIEEINQINKELQIKLAERDTQISQLNIQNSQVIQKYEELQNLLEVERYQVNLKIQSLQTTYDHQTKLIENLQIEIKNGEYEKEKIQKEFNLNIGQNELQLNSSQNLITSLRQNVQDLNQQICISQQEVNQQINKEINQEDYLKKINSLEQVILELREQIQNQSQLKDQFEELQEELRQVNSDLIEKQTLLLAQRDTTSQIHLNSNQQILSTPFVTENQILKQAIEQLKRENDEIKKIYEYQIDILKTSSANLEEQIKHERNQNQQLELIQQKEKQILIELSQNQLLNEDLQKQIKKEKEGNLLFTNQYDNQVITLQKFNEEKEKLKIDCNLLQEKNINLSQQLNSLQNKLSAQENLNKELNGQIQSCEVEMQKLLSNTDSLQQQNISLEQQIQNYKEQIEDLQTINQQNEEMCHQFFNKIKILEEKMMQSEEEIKGYNLQMNEYEDKFNQLEVTKLEEINNLVESFSQEKVIWNQVKFEEDLVIKQERVEFKTKMFELLEQIKVLKMLLDDKDQEIQSICVQNASEIEAITTEKQKQIDQLISQKNILAQQTLELSSQVSRLQDEIDLNRSSYSHNSSIIED